MSTHLAVTNTAFCVCPHDISLEDVPAPLVSLLRFACCVLHELSVLYKYHSEAPNVCVCVYVSRSVVSNSLRPHGLYPTRLSLSMDFSRQEYWSGLSFPSASTSYEVTQLSFAYVRGQQIMALGLNLVYHL